MDTESLYLRHQMLLATYTLLVRTARNVRDALSEQGNAQAQALDAVIRLAEGAEGAFMGTSLQEQRDNSRPPDSPLRPADPFERTLGA